MFKSCVGVGVAAPVTLVVHVCWNISSTRFYAVSGQIIGQIKGKISGNTSRKISGKISGKIKRKIKGKIKGKIISGYNIR